MKIKNRPSIAPSLPTLLSSKEDVEDTTGNDGIREEKGEDEAGETTNEEYVSKEEAHNERPKGKCMRNLALDKQNKWTNLTFCRLIDQRTNDERVK